jgi:hypothetical protein
VFRRETWSTGFAIVVADTVQIRESMKTLGISRQVLMIFGVAIGAWALLTVIVSSSTTTSALEAIPFAGIILLCVVVVCAYAISPFWIGRAAHKRGCGRWEWTIAGYIVTPLIVAAVYFVFVHRRSVLADRVTERIL